MRDIRLTHLVLFLLFLIMEIGLFAQNKQVSEIRLMGNKRTKASVILREITVKEGDMLTDEQLADELTKSKDNLLNTSLFNYVYLETEQPEGDNTSVIVMLKVEERWYIWPIFEVKLEDRNMSAWLKDPSWEKITYTGGLAINNLRGRRESLRITGRWGYERSASLLYQNIALDENQKHFLSTFFSYETFRNAAYVINHNEVLYAHSDKHSLYEKYDAYVSYVYRPKLREYSRVNLGFTSINIKDTILKLNPEYWNSTRTRRNFIKLNYSYRVDHRDSYIYPLEGSLFSAIAETEIAIDGDSYVFAISPEYQQHIRFSERWGYALYAAAKVSLVNANSHIHNQSLGYFNKLLRGYEYYVIEGQHYALVQNNFKFTLLPTKVVTLNFLSSLSKFNKIHFTFYLNSFFDAGYVYNRYKTVDNSFQNKLLYSGGIGLDLVTYYDVTLRVDYAINKQGERGFYFYITAPFM